MPDEKVTTKVGSFVSVDETSSGTVTLTSSESQTEMPASSSNNNPHNNPPYTMNDVEQVLQGICQAVHEIHDTTATLLTGAPAYMSAPDARREARTAAKNFVSLLSEFQAMMISIQFYMRYRNRGFAEVVQILAGGLVEANTAWFLYLYPDGHSGKRVLDDGLRFDQLLAIHRNIATTKTLNRLRDPDLMNEFPALPGIYRRSHVYMPLERCLAMMDADKTPGLAYFSVRRAWTKHVSGTFMLYIHSCTKMGAPVKGTLPVSKLYVDYAGQILRGLDKRESFPSVVGLTQ